MFKYSRVTPTMLMVASQRCKDCHGPLSLTGTPITGKLPTRCPECTVWVAKRLERSRQLRALLRTTMDDKEKAAAIVATARYEIYSLGAFLSVNMCRQAGARVSAQFVSHSPKLRFTLWSTMMGFGRMWAVEIYQGRGGPDPRIHFGVRV